MGAWRGRTVKIGSKVRGFSPLSRDVFLEELVTAEHVYRWRRILCDRSLF
jgi:hypothetical protein